MQDINDILARTNVLLGIENPGLAIDQAHDAKEKDEKSASTFGPKDPKVDLMEPDNDGDENFPDKDPRKTWEYGIPRGEGYHQYSREAGRYSTSGAIHQYSALEEKAPPDSDIENFIIKNKHRFHHEYGPEKGERVLYARAWNMYNAKQAKNKKMSEGFLMALDLYRRNLSEGTLNDRLYRVHGKDGAHSDHMASDASAAIVMAQKQHGDPYNDSMVTAHAFEEGCPSCRALPE